MPEIFEMECRKVPTRGGDPTFALMALEVLSGCVVNFQLTETITAHKAIGFLGKFVGAHGALVTLHCDHDSILRNKAFLELCAQRQIVVRFALPTRCRLSALATSLYINRAGYDLDTAKSSEQQSLDN